MMKDNKIIKSNIVKSGYTQRDLAKLLNISEVTISNWCNNKLGNIEKFIDLCMIIELDPRDIKKD